MARESDYVYYEADCTPSMINPFTDIHADNPSLASFAARPLKVLPFCFLWISIFDEQKVISLKEVPEDIAEECLTSFSQFEKASTQPDLKQEEFDKLAAPYYKIMSDDIAKQKKRLGGTFAVAHAVATPGSRDYLRKLMGPDLVFIVLNLTMECQKERLRERHGEGVGEALEGMFKLFKPAGENEENAYNVTIDKGMSKKEVLKMVLDVVHKL